MSEICVSVFMLTYQQKEYIAQAIEGVLMQKTSFKYELVIGEDFSTDGTREICEKYASKYPTKIKLILNERNFGIGENYVRTYKECHGKFVAICDGDDYWTDPLKLQKQVEILEKNPNYSIVYTNRTNLLPSGEFEKRNQTETPAVSGFKQLIQGNFIPSVTCVFKKQPFPSSMESWIAKLPYGDWPTYLFIVREGEGIYYLDEITGIYRKGGTSSALRKNRSRIGEINLHILDKLKAEESFVPQLNLINAARRHLQKGLMVSYFKENKFRKSIQLCIRLLFTDNPLKIIRLFLYGIKRSVITSSN